MFFLAMLESEYERSLFEELYSSNRTLMLKTAASIVPAGWAEDAVHNAFLRIAKHIEKFFAISCKERRWLCVSIVRNVSLNMLRDSHPGKMEPLDELNEPASDVSIADEILRVENLSDIEQCIRLLEPALRDVIDLRLVLGFNTNETAELLGISRKAVSTRLHRGRAKLKELLIMEGISHG